MKRCVIPVFFENTMFPVFASTSVASGKQSRFYPRLRRPAAKSAGSRNLSTALDASDKPRHVGLKGSDCFAYGSQRRDSNMFPERGAARRIFKWMWYFLCCCGCVTAQAASILQSVEVHQVAGKTSLSFVLSQPTPHRVFTLVNPQRVVIDFEKTRLAMRTQDIHVDSRIIKRVRSGHPTAGTLRLVFEVTQRMTPQLNQLPNARVKHGFRVDLATTQPRPFAVKQHPNHPLRPIVVILDPGHGGKDPGAHGLRGTKEKDIVLRIAQQLKQLIDKQRGMRAVLTRQGDYYVGLRERLMLARRYNADVFISIHADAYKNPHSSGVSVFALSQRGATSEAARWLAEKENYSELGGVNLSGLDDENGLVRTVLIDLSQTATVGASLQMGSRVLKSLDRMTTLHHSRVEQARFVVLKSPDIPSVLVETGFISNWKEEENLRRLAYQKRLVAAIFNGLKTYFWEYPPQGTLVEYDVEHQRHRVMLSSKR